MNTRVATESNIDRRYREVLFESLLSHVQCSKGPRGIKYAFPCPFCSANRKGSKKTARRAALIWIAPKGCFRFQCFNKGIVMCSEKLEFPQFLEQLDPGLFREYQRERFHAGTTGGRWNCEGFGN